MGFLSFLGRINDAHPWSHNDAYARFVMRHARAVRRRGGVTAVDVGCGTGNLLQRLSSVFPTVIGIEPDPATGAAVARRFSGSPIRVDRREFGGEPAKAYDLVVFVASLHHMPLRMALNEVRSALRPGGRAVIVGLAKEAPGDVVRSWVSLVLNPIVGLVRPPARATRLPEYMLAPTAEACQPFAEIRAVASEVLPGIRMRRRLFWRYTASWVAPI